MPTSKSGLKLSDHFLEKLRTMLEEEYPDLEITDEQILNEFEMFVNELPKSNKD